MTDCCADKVLLVSVGLSPQVVTETLHALHMRGDGVPSRLVLLTTRQGAQVTCDHLLDPVEGQIAAWGREWDVSDVGALARNAEIVEIDSDSGDMDASRALVLFVQKAAMIIRDLTASEDCSLHVSIAGGRKPAAAMLGVLMALYGRPQDRLSHVLIEPESIVGSDFFFPTRQSRRLFGRDGRAVDAADVRVRLLDLPFPRLRGHLQDGFDFQAAIDAAVRGIADAPRLVVVPSEGRISWDGQEHDWPPMPLAFLAMLADACISGRGISRTRTPREAFMAFYREVPRSRRLALPDPLDGEWVEEKVSRVNALARGSGIRPGGGPLVRRSGPWAASEYRLALTPRDIRIQ